MSKMTIHLAQICTTFAFCVAASGDASAGIRRLNDGYGTAIDASARAAFELSAWKVSNISPSMKTWYIPIIDDGENPLGTLGVEVSKHNSSQSLSCTYAVYLYAGELLFSSTSTLPAFLTGEIILTLVTAPDVAPDLHGVNCTLPGNSGIYQTFYSW
jgi:hypothetical protein